MQGKYNMPFHMVHKWSLFCLSLLADRVSHSSDLWNNRVHGLHHILFKVFRIDLQISPGVSAQFLFNEFFVHILQVIGSFTVRVFPTNNKNNHLGLCQKIKKVTIHLRWLRKYQGRSCEPSHRQLLDWLYFHWRLEVYYNPILKMFR